MGTDADLRLERLVEENFDRVAAYLLSRSDPETAADALAKTLEIVWRRLDDVPTEPLPWFLGIARRVLSDLWRSQNRRDALISRLTGAEVARLRVSIDGRDEATDGVVERQVALAALASLSDSERDVLLLVAWDGLTARQAAKVLACSHGAFTVRLFRARARLRQHLSSQITEVPRPAPTSEAGHPNSSPRKQMEEHKPERSP